MAPPPNIFGKNSKSEEQKPRNQKLRVENTGKKTKKKKEEEKKGKEEEELKDEEEEITLTQITKKYPRSEDEENGSSKPRDKSEKLSVSIHSLKVCVKRFWLW